MRKRLPFMLLLMLLLVSLPGCAKEEAETQPRQFFVSTYKIGKKDVYSPAWFDPTTGEVTYLCAHCPHQCQGDNGHCSEEVHGDACPFEGFSATHFQILEDTLYYFVSNEDHGDLYAYSLTNGERTHLWDTSPSTLWRSSHLFKGEYLYHFDSTLDSSMRYENMQRLHLPTDEWQDVCKQVLPWQIEDDIGFYLLSDSDEHHANGVYSQPLYTADEIPPTKTLLLHEITLGSSTLLCEDALYWIGDNKLPQDGNTVIQDLYRYDRHTQEIKLLVQNFGHSYLRAYGDYLYGTRNDGTRSVLMQVHATDGSQKVVFTPEDGWTPKPGTIDIVGDYVILNAINGEISGKIVYDIANEKGTLYTLDS